MEYWVARDKTTEGLWVHGSDPTKDEMGDFGSDDAPDEMFCINEDRFPQFADLPPGEKRKVKLTIEVI